MLIECVEPCEGYSVGDVREVDQLTQLRDKHWRRLGSAGISCTCHGALVEVEITPAEARHILDGRVEGKHRVSEDDDRVVKYRERMNDGSWLPNSAIDFYGGKLFDGRHRIAALAGATAPARFRVPKDHLPDMEYATGRKTD